MTLFPSTRLITLNTRILLALAAFGGLLVAAGCKGKDEAATDTSGTAAMSDTTGMGTVGTSGAMAPTGTMTDSTGMTTGAMTDSGPRSSGDTTTKR